MNQAMVMLKHYGDSVLCCQMSQIDTPLPEDNIPLPVIHSIKHQALYDYFKKVARPMWNLSLVALSDIRNFKSSLSNSHLFNTA